MLIHSICFLPEKFGVNGESIVVTSKAHAFTMMRDEHVHDDLTARFEKLRGRIRVLSTCSPPREPTAQATASLTAVIHPCAVKLAVNIRIM